MDATTDNHRTTYNVSGVYRIMQVSSSRAYIGSSKHLHDRLVAHRWSLENGTSCNVYLQAAYDKYGKADFIFEPLVFCSRERLYAREQEFINAYTAHDLPMFNLRTSVRGRGEYAHTKETKLKIGQANSGQIRTQAQRLVNGLAKKGIPLTPEHKARISAFHAGKVTSELTKQRMRAAWSRRNFKIQAEKALLSQVQLEIATT